MDLSEALHAARCGATIRDDGGSMKLGWKVKFVPDNTEVNMAKPPPRREGQFIYINPKGEDAHQIFFRTEHRASVAWNVVDQAPKEKPRAKK